MSNYVIPYFKLDFSFTNVVSPQPLISKCYCSVLVDPQNPPAAEFGYRFRYKRGSSYYEEAIGIEHSPEAAPEVSIDYEFNDFPNFSETHWNQPNALIVMNYECNIDSKRYLNLDTLAIGGTPVPDENTTITAFYPLVSAPITDRRNTSPEVVWGYDEESGLYMWLYPNTTDAPMIMAAGGGRYGQRLVVVGHECIYFGSL